MESNQNVKPPASRFLPRGHERVQGLILALAVVLSLAAMPAVGNAEIAYVQVATTSLRSAPQHWAGTIASLRYGDSVIIEGSAETATKGVPGWMKVKAGNRQGFIHRSAITDRQVVIEGRAGGAVQNANSGDIVLAGKGFNSEVESRYAARGGGENYAEVDRVMARRVSDQELGSFIRAGKLGGSN
jgi:hypothetical protein